MLVAAVEVDDMADAAETFDSVESVLGCRRRRKGIDGSRNVGNREVGAVVL